MFCACVRGGGKVGSGEKAVGTFPLRLRCVWRSFECRLLRKRCVLCEWQCHRQCVKVSHVSTPHSAVLNSALFVVCHLCCVCVFAFNKASVHVSRTCSTRLSILLQSRGHTMSTVLDERKPLRDSILWKLQQSFYDKVNIRCVGAAADAKGRT